MKLFGFEIRRVREIAPRAAAERWITRDGRRMTIGEMDEAHAKHSLAMILRNVREGKTMLLDAQSRVCLLRPDDVLEFLETELDGELLGFPGADR